MKDKRSFVSILLAGALLLIYVAIFLFRPVSYKLTSNQLIIHRHWSNIKIERKKISSVEQIEKEKSKWTIRTFGVGGLFGY